MPATAILTQIFKNAALRPFKNRSMEGHPLIELPHPISNLTPQEMRWVTLKYVDQLARQLTA